MMETLLGRSALIRKLAVQLLGGSELVLYGPRGVGKTMVLKALVGQLRAAGRPCGITAHTRGLGDAIDALRPAFPDIQAGSARLLRSRLARRLEREPAVLLLDHVVQSSVALKSFLRSLRGTGSGVIYAVDVEGARDHAQVRALRLCHNELALPALRRREMRRLLRERYRQLSQITSADDQERLLDIAQGRPGYLDRIDVRLREARYWQEGRVRTALLATDLSIELMQSYLYSNGGA